MGRKDSKNVSNYHFELETLNKENEVIKTEYFKTVKDCCEHLDCSRFTLYKIINNNTTKNYKHIKINKCNKPIFKQVEIDY